MTMTEECLKNLPSGKFVRYDRINWTEQNGEQTTKKIVVWTFYDHGQQRFARFCVRTGEYLGESFR